jgi:hypothetical protein
MKNLFFLVLLVAIIFLTGCPNDDPVKPDPCAGKKPVSAEIKIMQKVSNYETHTTEWIETDTIAVEKIVLFEAIGDYEQYEWQILGDTTKYHKLKQTFIFDKDWGELIVRLIVRSQPDTLCFPTDDGIDTAFKKILVVKREELAINGSYFGFHENAPEDTFTVKIKHEGEDRGMILYNINRGCFIPENKLPYSYYYLDYSNYFVLFKGEAYGDGCESPSGKGVLDISNNRIVIDYESGPKDDRKQYKFIGVKR